MFKYSDYYMSNISKFTKMQTFVNALSVSYIQIVTDYHTEFWIVNLFCIKLKKF